MNTKRGIPTGAALGGTVSGKKDLSDCITERRLTERRVTLFDVRLYSTLCYSNFCYLRRSVDLPLVTFDVRLFRPSVIRRSVILLWSFAVQIFESDKAEAGSRGFMGLRQQVENLVRLWIGRVESSRAGQGRR